MSGMCETFHDALTAAAAGCFDMLSGEQVAALEAHLNDCPRCSARLAGSTPAPDAVIQDAYRAMTRGQLPAAKTWERLWRRIEVTGARAGQRVGTAVPQALDRRNVCQGQAAPTALVTVRERRWAAVRQVSRKLWGPLAVAAAIALMVGLWRSTSGPGPHSWTMQLATNVEIDSLEVFGDSSSIILPIGDDPGAALIWVLDRSGA